MDKRNDKKLVAGVDKKRMEADDEEDQKQKSFLNQIEVMRSSLI